MIYLQLLALTVRESGIEMVNEIVVMTYQQRFRQMDTKNGGEMINYTETMINPQW